MVSQEKNNGFYVLLKDKGGVQDDSDLDKLKTDQKATIDYSKYTIVGQGYAWVSIVGNLTFDSWENNGKIGDSERDKSDKIIVLILQQFAEEAMKGDEIARVTIGHGGQTPKALSQNKVLVSEFMKEGYQYGDSKIQSLIAESGRFKNIERKIIKRITKFF